MSLNEPLGQARSELRELGSRFFAYVFPAATASDAEAQLAGLWKKYPDATHICYAFRLGLNGEEYRAADDGEPKYSSGVPILNQIKSAGLTNVLVAVVRYYGGTKLGVPGLVKAYGGATAEALALVAVQPALESYVYDFDVAPSQAGLVFDTARKMGAQASLLDTQADGRQQIRVSGKGDGAIIQAAIKARLA